MSLELCIQERGELMYSEDEDEFSSPEEGSDSEPMLDDDQRGTSVRRKSNKGETSDKLLRSNH